MAPRKRDFGGLSPTLMKLSLETNMPEPYEVSDSIVIPAPTRKRATAMAEADMERFLAQIALNQAYGRSQRPQPPQPKPPRAPVLKAKDKGDEEKEAAHAAALREHEEAMRRFEAEHEAAMQKWEVDNAAWDDLMQASQEDVEAMSKRIAEADDAYNRAFFGGKYDDVIEFFEDRPPQLWERFVEDIRDKFLPKSEPPKGECPECGQVIDADQAGNG